MMLEGRHKIETPDNPENWHCSGKTIAGADPEDFKQEGSRITITKRQVWRSPYLPQALEYYEQTRELAPDDARIRCNLASTAYARGNFEPMRQLEHDAAVELSRFI